MILRSIFHTLAGAVLLATSGMAVAGSHYVVATTGNTLHISLRLAHDGKSKTLFVPGGGGPNAQTSQVEAPACNGRALAQDSSGNWIAPASCAEVFWTVRPLPLAANGYDAARQITARIGKARWAVFSESTSLLRVRGETGPATIAMRKHDLPMTGGIPAGKQTWQVPAQNDAPEFYLIGRAPTQTTHFGGLQVTYVLDNRHRSGHKTWSACTPKPLTIWSPRPFRAHSAMPCMNIFWCCGSGLIKAMACSMAQRVDTASSRITLPRKMMYRRQGKTPCWH